MATRVEPGVDVVLEVLGQIVAELRGIRAALEQPRRPVPATLSRQDRARLARLLPALGGVFGSDVFTAADLFSDDAPAAVRVVVRGPMCDGGCLFQRAEGLAVEGTSSSGPVWPMSCSGALRE